MRPKAETPTVTVSFHLRVDDAALLKDACERLGVLPGRLLGRMIRAAYAPAPNEEPDLFNPNASDLVQHPRLPAVPKAKESR
jgi:hypothetical protein